MIISTKYLITGDGKTVLTDKAVYIGEDGKIGKIAPKEELLKDFRRRKLMNMVMRHFFRDLWICMRILHTAIPSRTALIMGHS